MSDNTMEAAIQEGSIADKWETFIEANNIPSEIAEKLQYVYYAGANGFVEAMSEVLPSSNTIGSVNRSVVALHALQAEVMEFFENAEDEELTLLTVKQESTDGQADSKQG